MGIPIPTKWCLLTDYRGPVFELRQVWIAWYGKNFAGIKIVKIFHPYDIKIRPPKPRVYFTKVINIHFLHRDLHATSGNLAQVLIIKKMTMSVSPYHVLYTTSYPVVWFAMTISMQIKTKSLSLTELPPLWVFSESIRYRNSYTVSVCQHTSIRELPNEYIMIKLWISWPSLPPVVAYFSETLEARKRCTGPLTHGRGVDWYTVLSWWRQAWGMRYGLQLAGIKLLWLVGLNMG